MAEQKGIGAHLGGHLRENGMMMALVAIVLFFTVMVRVLLGVDFLSAQNITNLFLQNSYVIIMALGMLLVIVAGHIDLSVGSVAVSYTHLDVYKRQESGRLRNPGGLTTAVRTKGQNWPRSVSYTHLDVYKRQTTNWSPPVRWREPKGVMPSKCRR